MIKTNHYEKRFNLHFWCSNVACYATKMIQFSFFKILCFQTFPDDPEKALHSLPPGLVVQESGIPGAGLGVWTTKEIPACTLFGPYAGEVVVSEQAKSSGYYAWQVSHCTARQCCPIGQFWIVLFINSTFIDFETTSSYWSVQFFSDFHWSPFDIKATGTGLFTESDQTVWAGHSCKLKKQKDSRYSTNTNCSQLSTLRGREKGQTTRTE